MHIRLSLFEAIFSLKNNLISLFKSSSEYLNSSVILFSSTNFDTDDFLKSPTTSDNEYFWVFLLSTYLIDGQLFSWAFLFSWLQISFSPPFLIQERTSPFATGVVPGPPPFKWKVETKYSSPIFEIPCSPVSILSFFWYKLSGETDRSKCKFKSIIIFFLKIQHLHPSTPIVLDTNLPNYLFEIF